MAAAKSDEIKAQVLAALLAGQGIRETARQFAVSHQAIIAWRDAAGIGKTAVRPDTRRNIEVKLLGAVDDILRAISKTAALIENPNWIEKQSADGVANLIGILSDRAFHILGAFEDAHPDPE